MNIPIDEQSEAVIRESIASGRYAGPTEMVREALRLLDERDRTRALLAELQIGLAQMERGELADFTPELLDDLSREAEERMRANVPIKDAVKP